jgi:hypothetical protein
MSPTKPTVEEMAAHIVSEVRYDVRHGKDVSASCDYAERRIMELLADAERAAYERAAKVALGIGDRHRRFSIGEEIAAEIRALIAPDADNGGKT